MRPRPGTPGIAHDLPGVIDRSRGKAELSQSVLKGTPCALACRQQEQCGQQKNRPSHLRTLSFKTSLGNGESSRRNVRHPVIVRVKRDAEPNHRSSGPRQGASRKRHLASVPFGTRLQMPAFLKYKSYEA